MAAIIQGNLVNGIVVGGEVYTQDGGWKTYIDNNPINKHFKSVNYIYKIFPDEKYIKLYISAPLVSEKNNLFDNGALWGPSSRNSAGIYTEPIPYDVFDLGWLVKGITRIGFQIPATDLGGYINASNDGSPMDLSSSGTIVTARTRSASGNSIYSIGSYVHNCGLNGPEPRTYYTELADGIK